MAHFYPKQIAHWKLSVFKQAADDNKMQVHVTTTKEGEFLPHSIKYEKIKQGNIGIIISGAKSKEQFKRYSDRVEELLAKK